MEEPRSTGKGFWQIGVFAILALVAFAVLVPNYVQSPSSPRNACINNLKQIDGAKEQWAIDEHKLPSDDSISAEVNAYIKGGGPKCPAGGKYSYGKVSEPPRCSAKDHVLPP